MKEYNHKHKSEIIRLALYFKSDVLIKKEPDAKWEVQKYGVDFPEFLNYIEYKVVAEKHLDMALEYYNDETNLGKMCSNSTSFSKMIVDLDPKFFNEVVYEFKKEL